MTEQWDGFQERIASWEGAIMPPHENTPMQKFLRGMEEVGELRQAARLYDGSPSAKKEVAEEAADVVIRMIGIVIATGGNMAEIIDRKISTIEQKYPADQIGTEMRAGVPYDVSMKTHKAAWQRRNNNGNGQHNQPRGRQQRSI